LEGRFDLEIGVEGFEGEVGSKLFPKAFQRWLPETIGRSGFGPFEGGSSSSEI
jgi:hypothetical protein